MKAKWLEIGVPVNDLDDVTYFGDPRTVWYRYTLEAHFGGERFLAQITVPRRQFETALNLRHFNEEQKRRCKFIMIQSFRDELEKCLS